MKHRDYCLVRGCKQLRRKENGIWLKGLLCDMHEWRFRKHGAVGSSQRLVVRKGEGQGYRRVTVNGKRNYEHRVVWEGVNGVIPAGYVIHHIDGNIVNNNPANLQCMPRAKHCNLHKHHIGE